MMTFGSLFSGIGGIDIALERVGMQCAWQVEIDPQCRRVLEHHWQVPRWEDVTTCKNLPKVDLIAGGFPCQDLSVAGNRKGFTGQRSVLFYEMTRIVNELRPDFILWENVPGLLSNRRGKDFLQVLLELDRIGYSGVWTSLDAQFFGLAQQRQRVFGLFAREDIGAKRCAEILSFTTRRQGDTPQSRQTGKKFAENIRRGAKDNLGITGPVSGGNFGCGRRTEDDPNLVIAKCLNSGGNNGGFRTEPGEYLVTGFHANGQSSYRQDNPTLAASDDNGSNHLIVGSLGCNTGPNGHGFGDFMNNQSVDANHLICHALRSEGADASEDGTGRGTPLVASHGVRRLTPTECLRLQGLPDDWLDLEPPLSDSAKYRMIGNSVAVPVLEWIGRRIVLEDIAESG